MGRKEKKRGENENATRFSFKEAAIDLVGLSWGLS